MNYLERAADVMLSDRLDAFGAVLLGGPAGWPFAERTSQTVGGTEWSAAERSPSATSLHSAGGGRFFGLRPQNDRGGAARNNSLAAEQKRLDKKVLRKRNKVLFLQCGET